MSVLINKTHHTLQDQRYDAAGGGYTITSLPPTAHKAKPLRKNWKQWFSPIKWFWALVALMVISQAVLAIRQSGWTQELTRNYSQIFIEARG